MKKFLATKINKEQWRLTVPNINQNLFRKSSKDDDKSDKESKRSSGFYDFQEAQNEYDKSRSLPNSVYVDTSCSESEEEIFEDARGMSDKKDTSDTDADVYTDVEPVLKAEPKNIDKNNSKYEYDVPRISFKFFEKELKVTTEENEIEENEHQYEDPEEPHYEPVKVVKSELKFTLLPKKDDDEEFEEIDDTKIVDDNRSSPVCHPSEKFVSHTEVYVNSLECIPIATIKSAGSDPNIALRPKNESELDDGFYQVPRSLKKANRLSQSLNDFDMEDIENAAPKIITAETPSIEHISASQILVRSFSDNTDVMENADDNKPDKKSPRKLSIPIRRPSFLKTPKKTVEKWNNFKTKFNNIMMEQAAQQRVGAYEDKEKIALNIENMYKNSKTKCRKMLQSTSKIFQKKKNADNIDDSGSEVVTRAHLKASDIEYKLNYEIKEDSDLSGSKVLNDSRTSEDNSVVPTDSKISSPSIGPASIDTSKISCDSKFSSDSRILDDSKKEDFDFSALKTALKKRLFTNEGQNGFEDLRRFVKQGGDFCKELAAILQERAEAESQYAKSLSKLSSKLLRSCREGVGGINEAWKAVAIELETRAEAHRLMGIALLEETAKPLKNLSESQHRIRKQSEAAVDKSARLLSDWRATEAKSKKNSHTCSRENEKLQDAAVLDTTKFGKQTISKSSSLIHLANIHSKPNNPDKENAKLEGKKRKAEDAVKKADVEYYSLCVRAERARLEWESSVLRGASIFQALEEERLNNLKTVLTSYLHHSNDLGPRLIEATERLKGPLSQAEPTKDLITFQNLRQSSQQVSEQLLPDFYCEHITLAMNRERRKQALIKLLHLIREDIERERKSKTGLENLSNAIKQTPSFGSEDSQQTVSEKLYHLKSMLVYLEAARYKVQNALSELDSRPRSGHTLAPYISVTRDKSGLQQSILKVPQWLRDEWCESDKSPLSEKSIKSDKSDNSDPHINDVDDHDWLDRGAADGNSNQPDSDFDEFSSQCSSSAAGNLDNNEENPVKLIATCRAIYAYSPNMHDELQLRPGDILSVYRQQDDGWWLGECNGNVGIFPATYVEVLSKTDNINNIEC